MYYTEDGESDEQVVLVSQSGTVNRIKVRDISIQSRYARYIQAFFLFFSFHLLLVILFGWGRGVLRGKREGGRVGSP